ncbi:MAG: alanine racemase [Acidimicrobiia bacterium]
MRPTYAIVDLGAIQRNVQAIAAVIAPSEVCAVVKADGYGHGDAPVAMAAIEAGATRLAVALVEEGIRLREAGVEGPIVVLSEPMTDAAEEFAPWDLTPTVYSIEFADALASAGFGSGVHLKIDTGMHRVGVSPTDWPALVRRVRRHRLEIEGVFTHFAVADADPDFTRAQIEQFDETVDIEAPLTHLANTPGALLFPEARRDFSRIGIGIYGLHPCEDTRAIVDLEPAMAITTRVSHVQRLPAGTRPSYGRIAPLERDSTVVTIPIGYADGFWRNLSRGGRVLIGGESHPVAGTVTMDQTMVTVGDAEVAVGDEVVLIGRQASSSISADEWADQLGTISYEVVCSIGPRVPRRYTQ